MRNQFIALTIAKMMGKARSCASRLRRLGAGAGLLPVALLAALAALAGPYSVVLLLDRQPLAFVVVIAVICAAVGMLIVRRADRNIPRQDNVSALGAVVEDMLGALVRYDSAGAATYVSHSASTLLGCREFELSGEGLFDRVHVMDRPAYRKAISDTINSGNGTAIEVRLRQDHADHSASYVWTELTLAHDAHGQDSASIVGIFRDISNWKRSEEELKSARAQAEDASEAKSRFLATIGHELRTPLNAIVGFSDMMVEGIGGTLSPTHSEYAGHIRQSGHHLIDVVNMLLDMSKIEAGRFEVQAERFAPSALIDPCFQMIEKLARDKAVTIESDVPERLPDIIGDERACRQIVINLLSNAIKFSHEGGCVSLGIKRRGKLIAISVSDGGIGMHPDTIKRIGEPFLQAQNGLSRRYEGTGLGLSIVKGLVSLHDGRLEVASEQGQGTIVTVLLPVDGPATRERTSATIAQLHKDNRLSDERKWHEDEKRSAAQ